MQKKFYRWKITKKDVNKKLLTFLKDELKVSNKKIKKALDQGQCLVNGIIERFGSTLLKKESEVKLSFFGLSIDNQVKSLKILYEDDFFLAIDKPTHFESSNKNIHLFFPKKYCLIHRLDKDASGVLLIAKNYQFKQKMIKDVFKKQKFLKKTYLAMLDGKVNEKIKKIETTLGKVKSFQGQTLYGSTQLGKYALTYLKVLKKYKNKTLVELNPITGRTHQLRVHMKRISHPILGDFLYFKKFRCLDENLRLMLHALKIEFSHPVTFENIKIASDIPKEFI